MKPLTAVTLTKFIRKINELVAELEFNQGSDISIKRIELNESADDLIRALEGEKVEIIKPIVYKIGDDVYIEGFGVGIIYGITNDGKRLYHIVSRKSGEVIVVGEDEVVEEA